MVASLDGYAYNPYGRRGSQGWPGFQEEAVLVNPSPKEEAKAKAERKRRACTIKRDECLNIKGPDGGPPSASHVFKHIAFDRTDCGDCSTYSPFIPVRVPPNSTTRI